MGRFTARRVLFALLGSTVCAAILVTASAGNGHCWRCDAARADRGRQVRGVPGQGVREFKGIPFAAPPVGELRFAPPAPVQPWQGVLDATTMRDACPQARRFGLTEESNVEDCLHLNVAVPTASRKGARPVLVWFYGGAFVGGSTKLYPIDFLAREGDMVVVSVNYRLGPLGFMAHPAFGAEANGGYALEDQRAALRWVQRNIAAFGGDPGNVTIGGVSAGAASVCMHLISPERTSGLFQQGDHPERRLHVQHAQRRRRIEDRPRRRGRRGLQRSEDGVAVPAQQAREGTRRCRHRGRRRRLPRLCADLRQWHGATIWRGSTGDRSCSCACRY